MSSGYFPLEITDTDAQKIIEAIKLIRSARNSVTDGIYDLQEVENGISDGGYLERIDIAMELLKGCVK